MMASFIEHKGAYFQEQKNAAKCSPMLPLKCTHWKYISVINIPEWVENPFQTSFQQEDEGTFEPALKEGTGLGHWGVDKEA